MASVEIDPVDFTLVTAMMESRRRVSHEKTKGKIVACRLPDLNFQASAVPTSAGWEQVDIGAVL
jgi:hypothetical protein